MIWMRRGDRPAVFSLEILWNLRTRTPQGLGNNAQSQSAKQKSSHIFSGCSFRVLSLMRFSLPANIIKENSMKRIFLQVVSAQSYFLS